MQQRHPQPFRVFSGTVPPGGPRTPSPLRWVLNRRKAAMIRRATPADAEALSSLSRTCFTQTFGHLYDPTDLAVFLDEAYTPDVLRAELADPDRATWLLVEDSPNEAVAAPGPSSPAAHPGAPKPVTRPRPRLALTP